LGDKIGRKGLWDLRILWGFPRKGIKGVKMGKTVSRGVNWAEIPNRDGYNSQNNELGG